MSHLVYERCVHAMIGKPTLRELGSNFALLGILEQPCMVPCPKKTTLFDSAGCKFSFPARLLYRILD